MKNRTTFAAYILLATGLIVGLAACSKPQAAAESPAAQNEHTRMGSHGMAVIG